MKIKELIERLQKLDGELPVVLASDEEGNAFEELFSVETNAVYNKKEREVRLHHLTPRLIKEGFTEEDLGEGVVCVVLYP
jgi:hypothetical protein